MGCCSSGRVRSAKPCRPSSSGGAISRYAMWRRSAFTRRARPREGPSAAILSAIAPPAEAELATLVLTAPMMPGAEYLTADILRGLWAELGTAFAAAFTGSRHRSAELSSRR